MSDRVPAEAFPPGEYLKDEMEERGWTQDEFAAIIGRPPAVINQILSGKRGISPETAREIGAALGTSAMYWMNLESAYRLWKAGPAPARIGQEGRIRSIYPVREMIRRGWIKESENPAVLESRILAFFGTKSLDETPRLAHAAKKADYPSAISGTQLAWLFRVKQIASTMTVKSYSEKGLREALSELRQLLGVAEAIRRVPMILAECGVRFVVVEHVPSSKIDGVCFWLDGRHPVIGLSLRLDRIDSFWFVLRHEIEHVLNKDGRGEVAMVDCDIASTSPGEVSAEEDRANAAAADFCVPDNEMSGFIARYRPIYSEQKLLGFAQRMNLHPGLVVGQLQRRTGDYRLFRKHLVNVRPIIAAVAMTDGYGQVIPYLGTSETWR